MVIAIVYNIIGSFSKDKPADEETSVGREVRRNVGFGVSVLAVLLAVLIPTYGLVKPVSNVGPNGSGGPGGTGGGGTYTISFNQANGNADAMVKRILENTKYTGADNYPRLVSDDNFAAAQRHKMQRNTYAPLPSPIQPIKSKAVCGLCGARLVRDNHSHGLYWKCQNLKCGQSISLSDEILTKLVDERLRELTQAPHLLTAPELKRAEADMEAIRLRNELTLALNRGAESPEYIKSLVLAVAAQRYRQLPDPTPAHELEQLRVRLEQHPADAGTLADLLRTAVRAVRFTPDKNVELELVNGTIIA